MGVQNSGLGTIHRQKQDKNVGNSLTSRDRVSLKGPHIIDRIAKYGVGIDVILPVLKAATQPMDNLGLRFYCSDVI